jgi:DNA polymerase (family 10)
MDLDWRVLGEAKAAGALISIGADAHSVTGLDNVALGVGVARKAGLGPEDILNSRSVEDFMRFAGARR